MRFHRGSDGWGRDSYAIPQYAVLGSSDTGYNDSPAPSLIAKLEQDDFRRVLRKHHIRSRKVFTQSGNVFMLKRWTVVHSRDYARALRLATAYLKVNHDNTRLIHDAT